MFTGAAHSIWAVCFIAADADHFSLSFFAAAAALIHKDNGSGVKGENDEQKKVMLKVMVVTHRGCLKINLYLARVKIE